MRDKAFSFAKIPKYDGYQRGIASLIYRFFDKTIAGGVVKNEIMKNKELSKELHKRIIRKFKKRIVHSPFVGNIWGSDLPNIQLISKFNKGICFLLCVIDIFNKNTFGNA